MKKKRFLALIGGVGGVLLTFAWENIQATRLGYYVEQTRKELHSVRNTNEYLRNRLQSSLSPARLQELAQRRLGMVPPEPDQLILLEEPRKKPKSSGGWLARLTEGRLNSGN